MTNSGPDIRYAVRQLLKDPVVVALSTVSIFAFASIASIIPARRAAVVEPTQAWRME